MNPRSIPNKIPYRKIDTGPHTGITKWWAEDAIGNLQPLRWSWSFTNQYEILEGHQETSSVVSTKGTNMCANYRQGREEEL